MNKLKNPVFVFLSARLVLFLSLPLEGLTGYGDLVQFYDMARLEGWPFFQYWMEYPPIFPFVLDGLYRLLGGREHALYYILAMSFTLAQSGSIYLFLRIAEELRPGLGEARVWVYIGLLLGLFYGWTELDPIVVFLMLLGIWLMVVGRPLRSAVVLAVGALVKWFPLIGIAALLRSEGRQAWRPLALFAVSIVAVWGLLFAASSELTMASLRTNAAKGSWETVWALIDGNLTTGNFGAKEARYDPATASEPQGHPAVIPSWITLIPFAVIGASAFLKARLNTARGKIAFTAFALSLFFLWSPGWSPQWVLYLLPLVLLLFPARTANLISILLVLVNLLEWPLLLSRGLFWGLYLTIPLRTLLLVLLAWEFWRMVPKGRPALFQME